jgi:hypothetical protein
MTTTIALAGAAGGQGTTTTALGLAAALRGPEASRTDAPQVTVWATDRLDDLAAAAGIAGPADADELRAHGPLGIAPGLALDPHIAGPAAWHVVDVGRYDQLTEPGQRATDARTAWRTADHRLLVIHPSYLALRRVVHAREVYDAPPTGLVVITDADRSLGARECADVTAWPIAATIPHDPAIARALDAGIILARLPRPYLAAVQQLAFTTATV